MPFIIYQSLKEHQIKLELKNKIKYLEKNILKRFLKKRQFLL